MRGRRVGRQAQSNPQLSSAADKDAVLTLVQEQSSGRSSTWIRIPDIAQVLRFELD